MGDQFYKCRYFGERYECCRGLCNDTCNRHCEKDYFCFRMFDQDSCLFECFTKCMERCIKSVEKKGKRKLVGFIAANEIRERD